MIDTVSSNGTFGVTDATTGRTMSRPDFEQILRSMTRPIEETQEVLEAECIALVTSLFQTKDVHPIKLDGKEINPIIGASPGIEYFHYIKGHTLTLTEGRRTYTSYTYINCVEMQEQMVIQDDAITAILINTFNYAGIRTSAPGHESWHSDLYDMREMLMEAVEQCA